MNSELTSEEIPPARLWHHQELLEEWFAAVTQKRQARYKGEDVEDVPEATESYDEDFEIVDPEVRALRG